MNSQTTKGNGQAEPYVVAIHLEEEAEPEIRFRIDDVIAFTLFWILGSVTFLQFFSRYVLNDSIAWTEEIGRYLLMWVTFFGAAIVFRRRTHIAVEVLVEMLPPRAARVLRFAADVITLLFVCLLVWFAWNLTQRMGIQRMTVIDVSMSVVYGGIFVGCLLMLWRASEAFLTNARRGWAAPDNTNQLID
ncbi:TRAP transporter small permease [Peteryoungia desertarenae]|uniref:TRAP transporter small permease protein n=1 Tax=Peteryoungia desertarenae TaxID=1813451 RepID=A0ABX6QQI4_9HYPH|nr:TRAP transporter small permease [Peteryoungia desertarenae]QLF70470.1 TRAP transporter small permease [Peteryoungia desertarenae]